MNKIYLFSIYILLLILYSINSHSYYVAHYVFLTEEDINPTNIQVIGWPCVFDPCTEIDASRPLLENQPVNLGESQEISISIPQSHPYDPSYGYLVRFYTESYRNKLHWQPWPDSQSSEPTKYDINIEFTKKDNCKAGFSPTITSCAEAGLPLSILTDTQLSAETKSAFDFTGVYYPSTYYDPDYSGENFDEWIGVDTEMRVDVKPQGSSSSVSGFPSTDQAFILSIPPHDTHNFEFLWQTSKDTDPGTYTVTMESTVPDAKCDQGNDIPVTKSFDVYIAPTLDGCVAELNSFEVNPPNPDINQEITFTGTHLNTFQDWSYTSPTVIFIPAL